MVTGGVIILAGVTLDKNSWVSKLIRDKIIFTWEWNKSADDAVGNVDYNRVHHIMVKKHKWDKIMKDPNWKKVRRIIVKTLKKGKESILSEKHREYERRLSFKDHTIVVRFIKGPNGLIEL